ncbi:MAG: hypothetical protein HUM72_12625 [Dolichospermum sp.]|nr:hypothetical protein [Dolichospermum sp.]
MSISEKIIENQILTYLNNKKIFAWKNQSTGVFDPSKGIYRKSRNPHHINGVSDILGVIDGHFLAIEVKKPYLSKKTGQFKYRTQEELEKLASEDQVKFINRVKSLGGIAFYADSIDTVEDQLILFGAITSE